jgi:hypothetical protein
MFVLLFGVGRGGDAIVKDIKREYTCVTIWEC